jgi:hypothetical protein
MHGSSRFWSSCMLARDRGGIEVQSAYGRTFEPTFQNWFADMRRVGHYATLTPLQ